MSNINLSVICFSAVGLSTTAYGYYSYCTAKGKGAGLAKQREAAKKVMTVGLSLMAVGVGLYFIGRVHDAKIAAEVLKPVPDYLKPYVNELQKGAVPVAGKPLTQFPPHLYHFPHPDLYVTDNGGACIIPNELPSLHTCAQDLNSMVEIVKETHPEAYSAGHAYGSRWYKGYKIAVEKPGFSAFTFGMDKQIVESHRKGLEIAEQLFLQDPQFDIRPDDEVVERIKKLHSGLMEKVLHQHPEVSINPGVFRTKEMTILDDDMFDRSAQGFLNYLKSHGGTEAEEANLKSWLAKLQRYGEEKAGRYHTPEEIEAAKKVIYFPLNSAEIPKAMNSFAKKLKEIYSLVKNRLVHPIAPAAWTHRECGHIHPFADGNGRECRALTNAVLSWGGIKGIVFPDDKEYTAAIKTDQKVIGMFARYLLDVIGWNAKQKALSA